MTEFTSFPSQTLSFAKKNKAWRKKCVLWAKNRSYYNASLVRKTIDHKVINYDLLQGTLHMQDLASVINPDNQDASFIPDKLIHYPIMNSKLNVLRGEEFKRIFDFQVVVTNPNAISEIEENKKKELLENLKKIIENNAQSKEEYEEKLKNLSEYYEYDWQDIKEIRANSILKHYSKELDFKAMFNAGFIDAMAVGEEMYQCSIISGEPHIEKLDPKKVSVYRSGYSNKIEDADIIVVEDYWSPGRIIDTYYESLTRKDIAYLEKASNNTGGGNTDEISDVDPRDQFRPGTTLDTGKVSEYIFEGGGIFDNNSSTDLAPFDVFGNVRVLQMFWKSKRRIKRIKSYDEKTGEEEFNFYPEDYVIDETKGEEEKIYFINEAWEGTQIGEEIFVNMRPRAIQYNRLSNPSKCHFGIIGSIYNIGDGRPFSLVDMMKSYNYLYDVVYDRVLKAIANNWGKIVKVDIAQIPKGWDMQKWLYYAKINHIAVVDSFKEGNVGAATGKLAGGLNNNTSGVIDAETGNYIQSQIGLLEFIKNDMAEVAGISKQREGQISNRETVGGVERSNLQSSYITEWLFITHESTKKRAAECFLETAKMALKGKNKKFNYILSNNARKIMTVNGDEFAEADYGLLVESDAATQKLAASVESLAQAALQNQKLSFSGIMSLYNSSSIAEKQRIIAKDEKQIQQQQQQQQQQQIKSNEKVQQMQLDLKKEEMALQQTLNKNDNDTKLRIEEMRIMAQQQPVEEQEFTEKDRVEYAENMRQFDSTLEFEREKARKEYEIKLKEISIKEKALKNKNITTSNK